LHTAWPLALAAGHGTDVAGPTVSGTWSAACWPGERPWSAAVRIVWVPLGVKLATPLTAVAPAGWRIAPAVARTGAGSAWGPAATAPCASGRPAALAVTWLPGGGAALSACEHVTVPPDAAAGHWSGRPAGPPGKLSVTACPGLRPWTRQSAVTAAAAAGAAVVKLQTPFTVEPATGASSTPASACVGAAATAGGGAGAAAAPPLTSAPCATAWPPSDTTTLPPWLGWPLTVCVQVAAPPAPAGAQPTVTELPPSGTASVTWLPALTPCSVAATVVWPPAPGLRLTLPETGSGPSGRSVADRPPAALAGSTVGRPASALPAGSCTRVSPNGATWLATTKRPSAGFAATSPAPPSGSVATTAFVLP